MDEHELFILIQKMVTEEIRPRTRVDGGDIVFENYADGVITVGAYGDCATCKCCEPDLKIWLEQKLTARFQKDFHIKINRYAPYYAR